MPANCINNCTITLVVSILLVILISCNNIQKNQSHQSTSNESILAGKKLAANYCQTCHELPDPSLLDASTWEEKVLPAMGPGLGIFYHRLSRYPSNINDPYLAKGYYPSKPVITAEQWQEIIDYYSATSPDTLVHSSTTRNINKSLPFFNIEIPSIKYNNPATGLVKIDTSSFSKSIIVSDLLSQKLFFFNSKLQLTDSLHTTGPVVNMDIQQDKILLCNIGFLNPTNNVLGRAQILTKDEKDHFKIDTSPIIKDLPRPVQITSADLNNDGITDYLTCGFGYLTGEFCWMEGQKSGPLIKHVLNPLPGAIKAYIDDYNHDGLPDIWVLMAHAEEGIFLYTNKGNGKFEQQELLRFPPVYGSCYFELDDFNKDGKPDILYTCGDNGDYSPVLKPYHGVYIFLNDGNNHFKQEYFFALNGCYKAIAEDYDNDGDLDIAAISFFADYKSTPEEGFVYLQNNKDLHFEPYTLATLTCGRWLTMDAGDFDGDGKIDLILGNCSYGPSVNKSATDWKKGPPFVILKNITQNK